MNLFGQKMEGALLRNDLQRVYIHEDISLHFISPEPIRYVDISTKKLVGNIPIENVFRIKALKDSVEVFNGYNRSLGIITIIGEKFIAQYDLWYASGSNPLETQIEILPKNTNPLDIGATPLSKNDLRQFSIEAYKKKKSKHNIYSSKYGISGRVNNIYTFEDYVFLDITYTNRTNLKFEIDQVRFKIADKRITKATNVQAIEIEPVYQLFDQKEFKGKHRNIYALRKFSFPNNKILSIELTESQISGRTLLLQIDYSDLLTADTL
ncbi:hypothetical protein P872_06090 [Rhodonellum psychrophilum GCM71 = DSM 17998]|uniref:Conjugative transposon protein TraN n=2 Tax=Rhodonellum TaxID=336827 RepID=U5C291_9BACT|nr:hypothetical protein P872_06090 [Rhodonellum psychrophilum GCM71 = DSM 17998]